MVRVLTGATLIDGTGATPVHDAAVVIDGDRIIAAGPRAATTWPATAEIVDVAGRTLIPGLIDAHDHMASHGYSLATRWGLEAPASTTHLRTGRVLAETLAMGYTTVRDAGGLDAGFKLAIEQGLIQGPRLVLGIQIISPTGGIGDSVSPSGHACCAVYDPLLPNSVGNGPDEVRDVVRTMVRAGADVIKTATTGGASSRPGHGPLDAAFSLGEMQALVTEAHRLGRKVATHAHSALAIKDAVRAAVDSVEHGIFLDDEGIQLMKEHKTFLVPTSYPLFWLEEHAPQMHFPQWVLEKAAIIIPAAKQNMTRAFRSGVRVALGTDAGVYPHGENGGEFWSMVTLGMAPIQALQAGTINAAELMGWSDRVGSIRKDKFADLVAVNGNPLADVSLLKHVQFVMKDGVVYKDEISSSAAKAEQ